MSSYCESADVVALTDPVIFHNGRLYHDDVSGGPFVVDETITGGTSSATGTIDAVGVDYVDYTPVTGTFQASETITGGTSSATATTSSVEPKTQPNLTEIESLITSVSAELDGILKAAGYSLPISVSNTDSLALLKSYARYGVACRAWHGAVGGTDRFPRVERWCKDYHDFLARLRRGEQQLPDDPYTGRGKFKVGMA